MSPTIEQRTEPVPGGIARDRDGTTGATAGGGVAGRSQRDGSIDVIRGACLVSMTVSHVVAVLGGLSVLWYLTHPFAWVGGASGFVFLSGVSIALADRSHVRHGWSRRARARWLGLRAAFLYLLHVGVTVGVLLVAGGAGPGGGAGDPAGVGDATITGLVPVDGHVLGEVLIFGHVLRYFDILPMYVAFIAAAIPLLLWVTTPRRTALVVAGAVAVYGATQSWPQAMAIRDAATGQVTWALGGWQLLFLLGLLAGRNWEAVTGIWQSRWRAVAGVWAGVSVVVLVAARIQLALDDVGYGTVGPALSSGTEELLLSKAELGPLRLLFAVGAGLALHWLYQRFGRRAGRWLQPLHRLGQRSLRVYLGHIAIVVAVAVLVGTGLHPATREVTVAAGLAALLWSAHHRPLAAGSPWSL